MNEGSGSLGAGAESTIDTTGPHVSARIIRGALLVGSVTLLVKAVGFVKEVWVASTYGRGDALEAFLIALVLPSIVAGIVGGAFTQAFLPIYMRVRRTRGAAAADRLFRHSLALGTLVLLGAAAALWIGGPWVLRVIAAGYEPEKFDLAVSTLRRLSPVCVLAGLPLMISTLLHSRERFGLVSLAQGAVPAMTLGLLLWWGGDAGILPLVVGVLAGLILETVALIVAARRLGHRVFGSIGSSESSEKEGRSAPESAEVLGQWLPAAGGMVFQQITTLVDQAMAAYLVAGSVAALSYAYKLIALPLGLATLSVGTAILPVLSELAGESRWAEFWQSTRRWLRISLWGSLVPAVLLFAFANPLVTLVYQRGSFGGADTAVVATVLAAYAGMIPFYVVGIVGVRVMSVLGLNRLLLTLGAVNLVTNVVGNIVLSQLYGAAGIAMATVIVYLISASLILGRLWRARRDLAVTARG